MPTFKIESFAEAKLLTKTSRSEKHGKEEKPAFSISLSMVIANTDLDQIDPSIREALWKAKDPAQGELPEVGGGTPVIRCNSLGRAPIPFLKLNGWILEIDDGLDATDPIVFGGCKVDAFSVIAQHGGGAVLFFRVGTSDTDQTRSGWLDMHLKQPIWITLMPPAQAPAPIDGTTAAFNADHPELPLDSDEAPEEEAGDAFARLADD